MGAQAGNSPRKQLRIHRRRPHVIPKMELEQYLGSNSKLEEVRHFETFEALIETFGEFTMFTDPDGKVGAIWNSLGSAEQFYARFLLGRPLTAAIHPRLLNEIDDLARRSAVLLRREERYCEATLFGVPRKFAVCAIPLDRYGEDGWVLCLEARDVTDRTRSFDTMAEREALMARAEQVANFGSWELDLKAHRISLSSQLMKIYELTSQEDYSPQMFWERMHPGDRQRIRRLVDRAMAGDLPFEFMYRYCGPNGRVRIHLAHALPLPDKNGFPDRAVGVIQDITDHVRSHQELRRLSQQLMNEQDNQRRRLARELHESAGQSLAALKMTLGRLREALPESATLAASLLASAASLADGAVREVRTVSYLLHPPLLDDAGLGPALRWYAKGFSERSRIRVAVEMAEPFQRYSQEIETTVFRVVQEALTNVHRYSGSATAEILLSHEDSQLCIEVRDSGCGVAAPQANGLRRPELGVGISGMRERVEQLDGIFEIDSAPGHGTTVRVLLPAAPLTSPSPTGTRLNGSPADGARS